jgi:hypothetical protein
MHESGSEEPTLRKKHLYFGAYVLPVFETKSFVLDMVSLTVF